MRLVTTRRATSLTGLSTEQLREWSSRRALIPADLQNRGRGSQAMDEGLSFPFLQGRSQSESQPSQSMAIQLQPKYSRPSLGALFWPFGGKAMKMWKNNEGIKFPSPPASLQFPTAFKNAASGEMWQGPARRNSCASGVHTRDTSNYYG